jgi:polysaccharide biosynthesis protein PslJ
VIEHTGQRLLPDSVLGARSGRASGAGASEEVTGVLSWQGAVVALVLVIWLIPIKSYKLPVNLPFNLEIYRFVIIALLFAWVLTVARGSARLDAAGHGKPLVVLGIVAVTALLVNRDAITAAGLETQAVKSLSFFVSYLIVYLLVTSTLWSLPELETVVRGITLGAAGVACFALVESRTNYNAFDHLHSILPFLTHSGVVRTNFAGGQLRVRASAQHPIALGVALTLAVPLGFYLASRATRRLGTGFWGSVAIVILIGAVSTKSRTVVLMVLVMLAVGLWVLGRALLRYWPLLVVLFGVAHFAAPGSLSHLYARFNPKGSSIVQQQQTRPGLRGSGRLADLGPGLHRWAGAPIVGRGLGTVAATGDTNAKNGKATSSGAQTVSSAAQTLSPAQSATAIIFDDQYMNTLVSLGAAGLIAVIWFVWGAVAKLGRAARRRTGTQGLVAACAISCAGFGAAMLTYDAFTFVQSTLLFVIIAAVGLRARSLLTS